MTTLDAIRDSLPDYARDLKLNLGTVLAPDGRAGAHEKQIWAVALASAIASRNGELRAGHRGARRGAPRRGLPERGRGPRPRSWA